MSDAEIKTGQEMENLRKAKEALEAAITSDAWTPGLQRAFHEAQDAVDALSED